MINLKNYNITDEQLRELLKPYKKYNPYGVCDNVNYYTHLDLKVDEEYAKKLNKYFDLLRLVDRFRYENDDVGLLREIYLDTDTKEFRIWHADYWVTAPMLCFKTKEVAQKAIDEVINPYTEKNPEVMDFFR